MRSVQLFIKRLLDIALSSIGGIIISPIILVTAILVKLDSKGPVFFRQERLGMHGKVFHVLKFRTMVQNAQNMGDGIFVKSKSDSRITRVGNVLRKTSIDELPQLWNVIVGDMSLVGPRPPLVTHPFEYNNYPENVKRRFIMRPGITGLAQVKYRNSASWDQRLLVDVDYVDRFSLWLDIKILALTFKKVIANENIYGKDGEK